MCYEPDKCRPDTRLLDQYTHVGENGTSVWACSKPAPQFVCEDEADTHLTSTVPAVFWLYPQLLVPVDQTVGTAGPLTVTALQLGQPGLSIGQLRMTTKSPVMKLNQRSDASGSTPFSCPPVSFHRELLHWEPLIRRRICDCHSAKSPHCRL